MEVIDSHMSEHFSAQAPTHVDIDMSAEYDEDTEYAMHDITEATTNDEEIYDAEFEEVPEHTEVEMDEYADEVEVVEDDEAHMGTYVPTDDAATVTDVTVEDVQLRSSPVPAGIPQEAPIRPISPHVAVGADLPLNGAPGKALAEHSPHSVATLVDDSEVEHLQADAAKDGALNEVIDLTENDEEPQIALVDAVEEAAPVNPVDPVDQALHQPEHEVAQDNPNEAEPDFYEAEESVAELPSTDPTATDQPAEQQEDEQHEPAAEVPAYLEIPEQNDQDGHSPIEEALVINQQVRDDAADSMEPSPPIRLYYRDESKGTDEIFEIFTSTGLEPHETTALLFLDNRTLFYEPLSGFFAQLRETVYFSGDGWETTEMGLRMDLGDSNISINEDHKQTEDVSLFKLSFIWSGLGLEGPLELTLVRRSERFVAQLARLVEQVEQRDLHDENVAEPPEVQHEAETGGNPEINSGDLENDDPRPVPLENDIRKGEKRALIASDEAPGDPPRGIRENESAQVHGAARPEGLDKQEVDGDDGSKTTYEPEAGRNLEETTQGSPPSNQDPTTRPTDVDDQDTEAQGPSPSTQTDDNTVSNGKSPSTPRPREDEYDEYDAEGVNDSAPTQTSTQNGESSVGWDNHEYDYEEDYDEEHSKHLPLDNAPNDPTDSDRAPPAPSAPKLQGHESLQNVSLKRHLDELEYEEYETPSAPSAPSSPASDHKRVKRT